MKSTSPLYGRISCAQAEFQARCSGGGPRDVVRGRSGGEERRGVLSGLADARDPVHRELAYVVRAVVEGRQPSAVEPSRVDDPFAVGAVVVDVADDDRAARLDRVPQ